MVSHWFRTFVGAPTEPQQRGWPEIASGADTLIAAPTGSGKTLSAFLIAIDRLVRQGIAGTLEAHTQILYISPLRALSNDVQKNLEIPLQQIAELAPSLGYCLPTLRAAVRTGDTPAHVRRTLITRPPHILVTTPESLFLMLTGQKSRLALGSVNTVIVDEIHALARDKRGSHLAFTLERLDKLIGKRAQRIGLSATQKPMTEVAKFLVGQQTAQVEGSPDGSGPAIWRSCSIVDCGFARELDLAVVVPPTELSAVCTHECWAEIYDKLCEHIAAHRSTLVFVNTRRLAERISRHLRERLGDEHVASHHGSLSKDLRHDAERRLKEGKLKAIVATASLELGIDVGHIDLVCQIGSPRSIATFLQRVGRAGHHLKAIPKGRLFALTRDELLECHALTYAVRQGHLDTLEMPTNPTDILAQQVIACCVDDEWPEDKLYELVRRAYPWASLTRHQFGQVVTMLVDGFVRETGGGKRHTYLKRDALTGLLRARQGARLATATSGGAIPDMADYRVVTEGERVFVGTVNEDFAIESAKGDIFQLGNSSWQVEQVRGTEVIVKDAQGAPATIPFWVGESPGRTMELSRELGHVREALAERIVIPAEEGEEPDLTAAVHWLQQETGANDFSAWQSCQYVAAQKAALGTVPSQTAVIFERFFDESGGMQLVIHAPFGARVNRAWGLAMRKRFCRSFDFELQASADDNGVVLSLGPQHSFPIDSLFTMLTAANAEDILVQALLAVPMFRIRWRWNATRALAVLRSNKGQRVPPALLRFRTDDFLTAVFPTQTACQENRPETIEIPDHPLVRQTVHDCLTEAMDIVRLRAMLAGRESGAITFSSRDTREPSPFSHSMLNANPYAFLDGAPLEERRARAVVLRRTLSVDGLRDLCALSPEVIESVVEEVRPMARSADELHDVLLQTLLWPYASAAFAKAQEHDRWQEHMTAVMEKERACLVSIRLAAAESREEATLVCNLGWVAVENIPLIEDLYGEYLPVGARLGFAPEVDLPDVLRTAQKAVGRDEALRRLVLGHMEMRGPTQSASLASELNLPENVIDEGLFALEQRGEIMRGQYLPSTQAPDFDWIHRRILGRIHRGTIDGLRKRVQPASFGDFWHFLAVHQHVASGSQLQGQQGLLAVIGQLQGFEAAASAWENEIIPGRVFAYESAMLDAAATQGEVMWARQPSEKASQGELEELGAPGGELDAGVPTLARLGAKAGRFSRALPVVIGKREDFAQLYGWRAATDELSALQQMSSEAQRVFSAIVERGALFFNELRALRPDLLPIQICNALSELAAGGLLSGDSFALLREGMSQAVSTPRSKRRGARGWASFSGALPTSASTLPGRFTRYHWPAAPADGLAKDAILHWWANQLLERYGIVFYDLMQQETLAPRWSELVRVYRRLEAQGEILGGRFISGVGGEQYALQGAAQRLRDVRDQGQDRPWTVVGAADPLNISGMSGDVARIGARGGVKFVLHGGKPVAVKQGGEIVFLERVERDLAVRMERALTLSARYRLRDPFVQQVDPYGKNEGSRTSQGRGGGVSADP